MTASAWLMLGLTWGVITFFTGRFLWKVLTKPAEPEEERPGNSS